MVLTGIENVASTLKLGEREECGGDEGCAGGGLLLWLPDYNGKHPQQDLQSFDKASTIRCHMPRRWSPSLKRWADVIIFCFFLQSCFPSTRNIIHKM